MIAMRAGERIPLAAAGALMLTLASCQQAATPSAQAPAAAVTCADAAIRLVDRGAGVHGAIVSDTLHMGGAAAPVSCAEPANESAGASLPNLPGDRAASSHQSEYWLIVIRYPAGTRLYVISRRADGTACVVDTNDVCVAELSVLPDDFDVRDLPADVPPTIPGGRDPPPAPPGGGYTPPTVPLPPGGGYTPPTVPLPPGGGYTPPTVPAPPGGGYTPPTVPAPPGGGYTPPTVPLPPGGGYTPPTVPSAR